MSDWSTGYVVDIPYTIGFYRELSPSWLELCLTASGRSTLLDQKRARGEPLRYLELAAGQCLSLNINAATHTGEFWGNDFNPDHALFGQNFAKASGANLNILHESINELLRLRDVPNFDVIALHGVWSWISLDDMRDAIKIIYDKLNTGGVVYVSYNSNPGWANAAPLRHLINIHARLNEGGALNSAAKFKSGIEFAKSVAESGAAYFKQSPQAVERLKGLLQQNENYLPHEYANANWHLLDFEQAHEQFSQAKLNFATSANLSDMYDSMALSQPARQLLANANNVVMRETIHDYLHNTMFRKDIWVKGATRLTVQQRLEKLRGQSFALVVHPTLVPKTMRFQDAEVTFNKDIYDPIVEFMAGDNYAPKTANDIIKALATHTLDHVIEALLILSAVGALHPARSTAEIAATTASSQRLNRHILAHSRALSGVNYLASPVIGSGVTVGRFQQMFLLAQQEGAKTPQDMAKMAWGWLQYSNERLVKDGRALNSDDENLGELTKQAEEFDRLMAPALRALKIV